MKIYRILAALFTLLLFSIPATFSYGQSRDIGMVVTRDPISLDPHATLDPGAPILLAYIYDTLVYQTSDGSILPNLAETWSVSDDQQAITFDLKTDIVFSDGSPFNADAVIYTFERLQTSGQRSLIYDDITNIADLERLADYSVRFHLVEPSATLLSALTYPYAGILSPSATEAAGDEYGRRPVGTGPFELESWVPESELVLVPNPNYRGHRPWVNTTTPPDMDRLRVRFSTDESARASALLTGEVDIAYFASGSQLSRFNTDDFTLLESPARGLVYLGFNTQRPPFDNVEVRQAIAQAINKVDILALAADGLGLVAQTALPPSVFAVDETLESLVPVTSPQDAAALLRNAGYG
ncbi:hypothetical protein HC928_14685, partial [bacterium]|nr:hypothetical protein [bacterium]